MCRHTHTQPHKETTFALLRLLSELKISIELGLKDKVIYRDYLLQDYSPDKDVRRQHIVESFAGLISIANFDLKNIFVLFTKEICKISGSICGHIAAIVRPSSPDIDNDYFREKFEISLLCLLLPTIATQGRSRSREVLPSSDTSEQAEHIKILSFLASFIICF